MATELRYTKTEKEKFITWEWNSRGHSNRAMRSLKMIRPICHECQVANETPYHWWEKCNHDPYWSVRPKVIKTPIYETDDDGDIILARTEERTKMIRIPNFTEVPLGADHNDGRGPEKMAERKGFVMPQDIGLAPMCQFYGCGQAWPAVRTDYGDYCNEQQAKLAAAREDEVLLVSNDARLLRNQLREIAV